MLFPWAHYQHVVFMQLFYGLYQEALVLLRADIVALPLPGFEPGSQAPEARVLSKLYYGGTLYQSNIASFIDEAFYTALSQHIYYAILDGFCAY